MAEMTSLTKAVRRQLGDFGESFRDVFSGDGELTRFDLSAQNVSATGMEVTLLNGTATDVGDETTLVDARNGIIELDTPPPVGSTLFVTGTSYALLPDEEIHAYIHEAVLQHTSGRTTTVRYRKDHGFIDYHVEPLTLQNLPEIEEFLITLLATIEALWALSTDAASDVDITTADGTHVPRSQRYAQLRAQIDVLTEKYHELCKQLNVGLSRIEVTKLRRRSTNMGRLVPTYIEREYDDYGPPTRTLPEIDRRHEDESGIKNPAVAGWW